MRRLRDLVRPGGRAVADPPPTCDLVRLTCVLDGLAHVVTDAELSSPEAIHRGRYLAVCGHLVAPAPLVTPDGAHCRPCSDGRRAVSPR